MKKVETKNKMKGLFGLFATLALAIGVGISLAPKEALKTSAAVEVYEEITSNLVDWSGEYLIVSKEDNLALDGERSTLDAEGNSVSVTITAGKISLDSKHSFEIIKSGTNYDIKSASGKFIYGKNTDANGMDTADTANSIKNEISYDSSGVAIIKSTGSASNYLVYNSAASNGTRFRYYKSGSSGAGKGSGAMHALSLFRKGGAGEQPEFDTLASIAIKTPATKLSFQVGETFNSAGLVLTAFDNSSPAIPKEVESGFSTNYDGITFVAADVGQKTVTVYYSEGGVNTETTYNITIEAVVPSDKFSAKGFGGYTTNGFASDDQTGTVGPNNTTLALRVFNGSNGQVRGNQSGIAANFSMRNIDRYPGYIRKIVLNGTGGTSFTASADRSLVNVGNSPYTLDNATTGTKVQGVVTSGGGVYTLTWTIPANIDARYFILHNLQAGGTMLAAADDAIQIFYEPVEDVFGTIDHITVDTSSSMLKKLYYVGEPLVTTGLLVTAFDTAGEELITNEYTTNPSNGYKFQQSDLGTKSVNVTVTKGGIPKSASYNVEVIASKTYNKLGGMNDVRYGQIYALGSAEGAASTSFATYAGEVIIDYNEESDSFTSVANLQLVTIGIGTVKESYTIQLLNGSGANMYYSWTNGNTLALSTEISKASSWFIAFDEDSLKITNASETTRYIGHNHASTRFAAYEGTSQPAASLFMDFDAYDGEAEALVLADAVNSGIGNLANKTCNAAYDVLSDVYSRLSVDGKAEFDTSSLPAIEAARERMAYLAAWTAANSGKPDGDVSSTNNKTNSLTATIIIGVIGLTTLAGYYFLRKKKEA